MGNETSVTESGEGPKAMRKNSKGTHHLSTPSLPSSALNSPALRHGRRLSTSTTRVDEAASKFNETGDFGLTLAETLSLSAYQQQLLKQTWPKVVKAYSSSEGPVAVFQVLGTRNPNAKNLFQRVSIIDGFTPTKAVDQKEHGRLLGNLFQLAIQKLNSPAIEMRDKCSEIGLNHIGLSGRGMTPRMWEDLGDCLIEFVCKADCVRKSRETSKAWAGLVSFMIDNMKSGYQTELRRRLSSSPRVERPREDIEKDFYTAQDYHHHSNENDQRNHPPTPQGTQNNHQSSGDQGMRNHQGSHFPETRNSHQNPHQPRHSQPMRRQSEKNLTEPVHPIHPEFHSDHQLYSNRRSSYQPPAPSPPPSHLRRSYNNLAMDTAYATDDRFYAHNGSDGRYSQQDPQSQHSYHRPSHGYQGRASNGHLLPTDDRGYYEEQMYHYHQRQPRVQEY